VTKTYNCVHIFSSGLDIVDQDSHQDAMDHVVTSIKRNGVAIKGSLHCLLRYSRYGIPQKMDHRLELHYTVNSRYYGHPRDQNFDVRNSGSP